MVVPRMKLVVSTDAKILKLLVPNLFPTLKLVVSFNETTGFIG